MSLREYVTVFEGEEIRVLLPEGLARRVDNGQAVTIRLRTAEPARSTAPRPPAPKPWLALN